MASIQFYLRDNITNDKKEHPVYVRVSAHQKSRYFSLGIWVKESQWNKKKQEVRKTQSRSHNSAIYNEIIAEVRLKFKQAISEHNAKNQLLKIRNKPTKKLTAPRIKNIILNEEETTAGVMFINYAKAENKKIENKDRYNTFKRKRAALNKFEKYITGRPDLKGSDLLFSEINIGLIKEYHRHLVDKVGNHQNTANKDIQEIGTFFSYAIEDEVIPLQVNPFHSVNFVWKETKKVFLTSKDLQKIIELKLKKRSLIWHVRNYFFFQIYTAGLRVSDLCVVPWSAVSDNRFEYKMRKTDRHKSLRLVEPAAIILENYRGSDSGTEIFPILDKPAKKFKTATALDKEIGRKTALINKYLKKIEKRAKLDKHISSHIARHTFANMALRHGWSKEQIQKALAHSSVRTTEKYLASFVDYKIDDDLEKLFSDSNWIKEMTFAA